MVFNDTVVFSMSQVLHTHTHTHRVLWKESWHILVASLCLVLCMCCVGSQTLCNADPSLCLDRDRAWRVQESEFVVCHWLFLVPTWLSLSRPGYIPYLKPCCQIHTPYGFGCGCMIMVTNMYLYLRLKEGFSCYWEEIWGLGEEDPIWLPTPWGLGACAPNHQSFSSIPLICRILLGFSS